MVNFHFRGNDLVTNNLKCLTTIIAARKFATETMLQQKKEFESWGVTADWNSRNNVYRTYDASYIKNQLNLFYELYEKKLIFRDFKPVYYSPSSR